MLLQKRKQFEGRSWVYEPDRSISNEDPLFEREWEVLIVKRDPETGEFVALTAAADEVEHLS